MAARDQPELNLELLGQSRRRKIFSRMAMAHGERSRAYDLVGSSAARASRTAMAGAPFDPLYCTSLSFSLGQGQSRNAGLAASELGDGALLPYSHPHCTSLSFSPGQGQNGQPPGPASGGGWKAGLAASELGYEAPLPTWVRFGSVRFG